MTSSETVLDTESVSVTMDEPLVDSSSFETQEEILQQLEVTNGLLGNFYALAIFIFALMLAKFLYKLVTDNIIKHIIF